MSHVRRTASASLSFVFFLIAISGCSYRLQVPNLPQEEHVRVIGASPERYVIRVSIRDVRDYAVAPDGRVTIDVPAYRPGCSIYLFDKIKVHKAAGLFPGKSVEVLAHGRVVKRLSQGQIAGLPTDSHGYHLLRM